MELNITRDSTYIGAFSKNVRVYSANAILRDISIMEWVVVERAKVLVEVGYVGGYMFIYNSQVQFDKSFILLSRLKVDNSIVRFNDCIIKVDVKDKETNITTISNNSSLAFNRCLIIVIDTVGNMFYIDNSRLFLINTTVKFLNYNNKIKSKVDLFEGKDYAYVQSINSNICGDVEFNANGLIKLEGIIDIDRPYNVLGNLDINSEYSVYDPVDNVLYVTTLHLSQLTTKYRFVSDDYTTKEDDYMLICNGSKDIEINLSRTNVGDTRTGQRLYVVNVGTGLCRVQGINVAPNRAVMFQFVPVSSMWVTVKEMEVKMLSTHAQHTLTTV
jgi:hypothetical protein